MDSIRGPFLWQNGPKLNGTLGRDWPGGLGEKPEPEGTKDSSVQLHKIQIALSIYHSILAQVALRPARLSTPHPYHTCPEPPGGKESPSAPHTRHLVRLRTLTQGPGPTLGPGTSRSLTTQFTISMSQEEKKHLEPEGKQVRVTAGDR